ncbi:nitrogen regulatory protein P-II homolog [Humulus lupulus]|uniref:nitrogen regulatory protein P-II homolog n=1 Tax=Humulus lupulus TaxID=3486 RepID=UPI002B416900|nr:nitrogen regulatory protein P-II homolog [Humulus lupulus]
MASMAKAGALSPIHSHLKRLPLVDSTSIRTTLKHTHLSPPNLTLTPSRNAFVVPVVRAQSSPDYIPDSQFYKVEAILRPWRVENVSSALLKMGIRGVTVSDVRGFGSQGGSTERQGGSEFSEDTFIAKVKMEIVVRKDQVEAVVDKIIEEARTGEIGDGKIFLIPVADIIRVRTGERGEKAERMTGGHSDMSGAA